MPIVTRTSIFKLKAVNFTKINTFALSVAHSLKVALVECAIHI